jgi:flagellar motor switch protein FliM
MEGKVRGLEAVVRTAPVELTVTLGKAEVPLAQIDDLKPGDVSVLGQRVGDPPVLAVAGWEKFLAWPGRVRARQACQIASPLDR